jgi:hypothetical protein
MEKYYYLDSANNQHGPVEASELAHNGVTSQTFVWREGLAEWKRAGELPELSEYIQMAAPDIPGGQSNTNYQNANAGNQYNQGPQYAPGSQQQYSYVPAPSSNLVFAIIVTIFCCMPTGLYAVICAAKVDPLWTSGRYAEAREMSKKASLWSWISLGLSIILWLITMTIRLPLIAVMANMSSI